MKKILTLVIAMLMRISLSSFAGTKTNTSNNSKADKASIPTNIVIKQTITFDDGNTIAVFYEKKGQECKLYSKTDVSKYGVTDLCRIKSTNFEKTDHVRRKVLCYQKCQGTYCHGEGFLEVVKYYHCIHNP